MSAHSAVILDCRTLQSSCESGARGLLNTMPGVSGYRQDVVMQRELVKGQPCSYEQLPIEGIIELWFESPATLEAAFASPQEQRTMAHAKTVLAELTAFQVVENRIV